MLVDTIKKSTSENEELKKTFIGNLVLSGGTSMMPGFKERIENDVFNGDCNDLVNYFGKKRIVAEGDRYISTWIGESMVASMASFEKVFIRRDEYQESGEDRISAFAKIF